MMNKRRSEQALKGDERKSDGRQTDAASMPPHDKLVRRRRVYTFLMWLLVILALFFAWAAFGMMMRIGFLPVFDLGYSWFDTHILVFFGILAD